MHINTNLHKIKTVSSKDRLDTKIMGQFSELQDKKPFIGPFYRLKT